LETTDDLRAGHLVLAIGRSAETGVIAALGVISTVADGWNTWRGGRIDKLIRLDARLFPASSRSAVINAHGKLVGLATDGLSRNAAVAIPVFTISRVVEELLQKGHVARGYLGVGLQPVSLGEHLINGLGLSQNSGLIVLSVEPDSPAGKAGLV